MDFKNNFGVILMLKQVGAGNEYIPQAVRVYWIASKDLVKMVEDIDGIPIIVPTVPSEKEIPHDPLEDDRGHKPRHNSNYPNPSHVPKNYLGVIIRGDDSNGEKVVPRKWEWYEKWLPFELPDDKPAPKSLIELIGHSLN